MLDFADMIRMESIRDRVRHRSQAWQADIDGDFLLNPDLKDHVMQNAKKPAAVLLGLVERNSGANLILTKRTENLASHSGQIAFPGGKIDPDDASPEDAALREANEEIGLDQSEVTVLGRLPDYHSGSGFVIAPVIAEVGSDAGFEINPEEVEYLFEVPLAFLMDPRNHVRASRMFMDAERHYYEMPYQDHYIWGVTAGMIRVFHDRIFSDGTG